MFHVPIQFDTSGFSRMLQVLMIDDRNSVTVRRTSVNRFSESLPDYEDVKVERDDGYRFEVNHFCF